MFMSDVSVLRMVCPPCMQALLYRCDDCCRDFATVCNAALELNSRLIGSEQFEYHDSLQSNFKLMKEKLQEILSEQVKL